MPLLPRPFYLIRHGQSAANAAGRAAGGGLDSPLTDEGMTQARALADLALSLGIRSSAVVHSSMIRATETARPLAQVLGLPMQAHEGLREHYVGTWEGMDYETFRPLWASGITPPDGESHNDFGVRVRQTFDQILTQFDTPIIVTHGGVFRAIGLFYKIEIAGIRNAQLHRFDPEPNVQPFPWRVVVYTKEGTTTPSFSCDTNRTV